MASFDQLSPGRRRARQRGQVLSIVHDHDDWLDQESQLVTSAYRDFSTSSNQEPASPRFPEDVLSRRAQFSLMASARRT